MGKEMILIKSEEKVSRFDAATFLRQLADKLDSGKVTLKQGSEELLLEIPAQITLEVKAEDEPKRKGTQRSLEIEFEWMLGADVDTPSGIELG